MRWPMLEGNMKDIFLWFRLKVRYESAAKLDPLKRLYRNNSWSLKLNAGVLLVEYIDQFQGLAILKEEIDKTAKHEDDPITQMVEHIEDPLFYSTYKSIKN